MEVVDPIKTLFSKRRREFQKISIKAMHLIDMGISLPKLGKRSLCRDMNFGLRKLRFEHAHDGRGQKNVPDGRKTNTKDFLHGKKIPRKIKKNLFSFILFGKLHA
jgi:hypothetical protein